MALEPVRKSILVRADQAHTFATYTAFRWWPKSHSLLPDPAEQVRVVLEPRVGGRWYEVGDNGAESDWGRVLAWDAPRRVLLAWQINGEFKADASALTELEIIFTPEGDGTRVDLEHRGFENYATTAQKLRNAVGNDQGWPTIQGDFARFVESAGDEGLSAPKRA
jgi:uncharacterized protein YndB with AHSA1/START domain